MPKKTFMNDARLCNSTHAWWKGGCIYHGRKCGVTDLEAWPLVWVLRPIFGRRIWPFIWGDRRKWTHTAATQKGQQRQVCWYTYIPLYLHACMHTCLISFISYLFVAPILGTSILLPRSCCLFAKIPIDDRPRIVSRLVHPWWMPLK